jgi:hypothetical protein
MGFGDIFSQFSLMYHVIDDVSRSNNKQKNFGGE